MPSEIAQGCKACTIFCACVRVRCVNFVGASCSCFKNKNDKQQAVGVTLAFKTAAAYPEHKVLEHY